jgi:hypothetical protein
MTGSRSTASLAVVIWKLSRIEAPRAGVTMKPDFVSPKFKYFVAGLPSMALAGASLAGYLLCQPLSIALIGSVGRRMLAPWASGNMYIAMSAI